MVYNFDEMTDRRNTNALKWDVGEQELPMWVADMDFKTAPEITEALAQRVQHGIFGYAKVPESWYQAMIDWWRRVHHVELLHDWLIFCTGVVPAISSIVRRLAAPNENVVLLTPVYNIFYNSIINNGCRVLESPLIYNEGEYEIDFDDLEEKLLNPQTSLLILCNPHNPIGKIWNRGTLARIGELCARHHVIVLSDEIHCDLTDPGKEYIPFVSVSEVCRDNSITCIAPTKAFNLAGIQTAAVVVPNSYLRHKVNRGLNTDEVAEPNVFATVACEAAFTRGGPWLTALREYLYENKKCVREFVKTNISGLKVTPSEATYLLWIDCSALTRDTDDLAAVLRKETGLYVSEGSQYGGNGRLFLRLNVACPRERLQDGLHRLKTGCMRYAEQRQQQGE